MKELQNNEAIIPFNLLYNTLSRKISNEQNLLHSTLNSLNEIVHRSAEIHNRITHLGNELTDIRTEIARIDEELSNAEPGSAWYQELINMKNDLENQKGEYESQLQSCEQEKNDLYQNLPDGIEVTPETLDEKIAELQARSNTLDHLNHTLELLRSGTEIIVSDNGEDSIEKNYSVEERETMLREMIASFPELFSDLTLKFSLSSHNSQAPLTEESSYTVVGILIPVNTLEVYVEDKVHFNDTVANDFWEIQKVGMSYHESSSKYRDEEGAIFTKLYVPYNHSDAQTNHLWNVYSNTEFSENDSRLGLRGNYIESLQMIDSFVEELSTIFFYVGLVLAVFAILLFSSFISVSISQKRREIGILRAVGARSLDVFKIFFSESLAIAAICSLLSIFGSAFLCKLLNVELGSALGASIFVFGIPSILIIFAIALLTAFLATFLPVWNAAKKKPVDSIRAI